MNSSELALSKRHSSATCTGTRCTLTVTSNAAVPRSEELSLDLWKKIVAAVLQGHFLFLRTQQLSAAAAPNIMRHTSYLTYLVKSAKIWDSEKEIVAELFPLKRTTILVILLGSEEIIHGGAQQFFSSGLIQTGKLFQGWNGLFYVLFFDGLMRKYNEDQRDCKEENSSTKFSDMTLERGRGPDWCAVLPFRHNEPSTSHRDPCNGLMVMKWPQVLFLHSEVRSQRGLPPEQQSGGEFTAFWRAPELTSWSNLLSPLVKVNPAKPCHEQGQFCTEAFHSALSMNWPTLEINMEVSSTNDSQRLR